MKLLFVIFISVGLLSGCTTSGVVQTGPDSFMARAHSTLFTIDPGGGGAIANAIQLATEYCSKLGKYQVTQSTQTAPIGAGAQAIVNFECVDKTDKDYKRPNIKPMIPGTSPTVIINNQ
ncbi:hypothetical protein [Methylomagnum sp.]